MKPIELLKFWKNTMPLVLQDIGPFRIDGLEL